MWNVLRRPCIRIQTGLDIPEVYLIAGRKAKWGERQSNALVMAFRLLRNGGDFETLDKINSEFHAIYIGDFDDTNINRKLKYIFIRYRAGETDEPSLLRRHLISLMGYRQNASESSSVKR